MSELTAKVVYRTPRLSGIRVFFLYAFVFSLPFDKWQALYLVEGITLNKSIGLIYFFLAAISLKPLYTFSRRDLLMLPLVALWFLILCSGFFSLVMYGYYIDYSLAYLSLVFVFYAISKEVSINPSVRKNIFITFIYSITSVFILLQLGFGIQASGDAELLDSVESLQRVWFFGLNPNSLGNFSAFAILFCFFIVFEPSSRSRQNYIYLLFIIPLVYLLGLSGSAGSFITLFVSIFCYFLLMKASFFNKIKYFF